MAKITRIDLVFQTTSPLCINSPEKKAYNPVKNSWGQGADITTVQRMRIASDAEGDLQRGHFFESNVPIVPANTTRGLLRRAAADIICQVAVDRSMKIDLDTYHVLTCGSPHGYPDSSLPMLSEVLAGAGNPYYGVFGGTSKLLRSGLRVGTGFACTPATVEAGLVPPVVPTVQGALTQVLFIRKVDDALTFRTPLSGKVVSNYLEAVEEYRALTGGQVQEDPFTDDAESLPVTVAPEGEKKLRGVTGWMGHEFVVPNVPFAQTLSLSRYCGEAHAGLLMLALRDLVNQQQLGGMTRYGYGQYRTHGQLTRVSFADGTSAELFRPANDSRPPYELNTDCAAIAGCVAAWEDIVAHHFDSFLQEIVTLGKPALTLADIKGGKATSKKKAGKDKTASVAG